MSILISLVVPLLVASAGSDPVVKAARETNKQRERVETPAPVVDNLLLSGRDAGAMPLSVGPEIPNPETPAAAGKDATPATAKPDPASTEAYWREQLAVANARIATLERDLVWTQQLVFNLRLDLVVPLVSLREFSRKLELDQRMREQSAIEADLATARGEPARIRERARRAGVLPGWLR